MEVVASAGAFPNRSDIKNSKQKSLMLNFTFERFADCGDPGANAKSVLVFLQLLGLKLEICVCGWAS